MARRKKPQITGSDPEYTSGAHQFTKLPTNKASEPKVPPAETPTPVQAVAEPPVTETKQKPKPPAPKSQAIVPPAPKKARDTPKPAKAKPANAPKQSAAAKPSAKSETRRVELLAALTPKLHEKLMLLEEHGIPHKDAMSVAGRRATKEFEASSSFVEKTEEDRLPTAQAYRSSKSIPVEILETLHDAANPLRLASDGAMVRGQFEPLFWKHLEDVIAELTDRFAK